MIDKETAIELAKEAGFKYFASWALGDDPKIIRLQRLCNLAVAHEARDLALVQNLLKEYGLQALDVVEAFKAQNDAEPVWIQPDHLEKAKMGPYLCRVEPTQRMADFVPLFTHPAHDDTALLRQALEGYESIYGRKPERIEKIITALRERLGESNE